MEICIQFLGKKIKYVDGWLSGRFRCAVFLAATKLKQLYESFSPSVLLLLLLEDLLRCWKMNWRSMVLLEDQLYWRQSTGLDGNYRSRKITARRWLHKYVGAECGESSFTWYLYQICNTDVRLSVCLSVRHTFLTMFPSSYHHEIFRSYYQWQKWRPCKRSRSKVKVTEVTTQLNRFRTVTPVWIHIWWWNDAYSLIMLRRGALLFSTVIPSNFKVTRL